MKKFFIATVAVLCLSSLASAQSQSSSDAKIERIIGLLEKMDTRLTHVEGRVNSLDSRLSAFEGRSSSGGSSRYATVNSRPPLSSAQYNRTYNQAPPRMMYDPSEGRYYGYAGGRLATYNPNRCGWTIIVSV